MAEMPRQSVPCPVAPRARQRLPAGGQDHATRERFAMLMTNHKPGNASAQACSIRSRAQGLRRDAPDEYHP